MVIGYVSRETEICFVHYHFFWVMLLKTNESFHRQLNHYLPDVYLQNMQFVIFVMKGDDVGLCWHSNGTQHSISHRQGWESSLLNRVGRHQWWYQEKCPSRRSDLIYEFKNKIKQIISVIFTVEEDWRMWCVDKNRTKILLKGLGQQMVSYSTGHKFGILIFEHYHSLGLILIKVK